VPNKANWPVPGQRGGAWYAPREPGPIVRNEANFFGGPGPRRAKCAEQTQFFDCGFRIVDCGFRTALRRDAPCGPPGQGPGVQSNPIRQGHLCETNPNLGELGHLGGRRAREGQWRKTNPILRSRIQDRPAPGEHLQPAARTPASQLCKTNPISRSRDTPSFLYSVIPACQPQAFRAKRTQLGPGRAGCVEACGTRGVVQTNPIPAVMPIRRSAFPGGPSVRNKTRPTKVWFNRTDPRYRPGNAGRNQLGDFCRGRQTKPISSAGRGIPPLPYSSIPISQPDIDCAKRTQFGPAWAGPGPGQAKDARRTQFPVCRTGAGWADRATQSQLAGLGGPEGAVRGPCKTKPMSPVGQGPGGRNTQNEPNSGQSAGWTHGSFVRNKANWLPAAQGRAGRIVRNKVNWPVWVVKGGYEPGPIVQNKPNFRWPRTPPFQSAAVCRAPPGGRRSESGVDPRAAASTMDRSQETL
jgi:hypothetical protein